MKSRSQEEMKRILVAALDNPKPEPDWRGFALYLAEAIVEPKSQLGRPRTQTAATEENLLSNFELIRDYLRATISSQRWSVRRVLEWVNSRLPRSAQHSRKDLATIERRISCARSAQRKLRGLKA